MVVVYGRCTNDATTDGLPMEKTPGAVVSGSLAKCIGIHALRLENVQRANRMRVCAKTGWRMCYVVGGKCSHPVGVSPTHVWESLQTVFPPSFFGASWATPNL